MADDELYAMAARTREKVAEALSDLTALNRELRNRVAYRREDQQPPRPGLGRHEGAP